MRAGANEATAATDKVQRGAKGAAEATGRLEAQFKSTGAVAGALKKTVGGLFAGLTAFTVLRQAVKVIADFELTMRTLQGVSGATAEEFELLESAARKLGATTKFSATEAAEGLLFLARAGFSTQQSLDAINATLQLAQVGLIDLGQAADIASNVVKGFQLEAKETSRVAEGLVIVANRSNTNITALAEAMKFAAPVAASLGISFEEAAAAVGAMGDAGIPAGMAGRSLRGIFRGLVAPTSEATKTLKEMGITLDEVNPEKVGLTAAFERLNAAGAGFKEMLAIVGTESVTAAIVLADSTDTMDMLVEATGAAKGELEALAAAMNDTIPGAFKSLISAIQEAFLQLGDSGFGGALKDLIQTATGTIRFFIGMQLEADKASVAVERLTQTVIFLTTAVAAFIAMKLPVHLMAAVKAVTALTFAMMKNPFGLAAVAIAAVITALVDVQNGMDGFLESVFRIADFVRATFSIVAETIQITFDGIFKHVKKGVDGLIKMVKTLTEVSGFKLDLSGVGAGLDEFLGGPGIRADAQFAIDEITKRANSYRDLRAAAREAAEQEEENANTAAENANKVADLSEEELQRIKDIQAANAEKAEEGERQIHAMFDDLRLERELLKLTNDEREREEELIAARRIANESGFDASEKLFMDLEAALKVNQALRKLKDTAQSIGDAFADAFLDVATSVRSAEEAVEDLARSIMRLILQQTVAQAVSNAISGGIFNAFSPSITPSAQGNVFEHGRVQKFAKGGVVDRPTAFPLSGGIGVAGEAGPEAIIPLERGEDGNLGVRGGVVVNMTINTPDADSFRRSRSQISRQLQNALRR